MKIKQIRYLYKKGQALWEIPHIKINKANKGSTRYEFLNNAVVSPNNPVVYKPLIEDILLCTCTLKN